MAFLTGELSVVNAGSETSRRDYPLANGVMESTVFVTDGTGTNLRLHMIKIDRNANVSFKATAANYYKNGSTASSRAKSAGKNFKWGFSKVSDQIKAYESSKDSTGTVIAGINGDFYYMSGKDKGKTFGNLIIEGNKIRTSKKEPYFAVMKNGRLEIRSESQSTSQVSEAASGNWLVRNKANVAPGGSERHSRQAIGLTSGGDVLIVMVDGREPSSLGISQKELAKIFIQQDCKSAINLDGGGSAILMTRRSTNAEAKLRSGISDGFLRNVPSALLLVENDELAETDLEGEPLLSMEDPSTKLYKNASGAYVYVVKGKKQKGFFMINDEAYLFDNKGNGATKKVQIGDHKYTFVKGKLTGCSDPKAGDVKIGYCGAGSGGKNLVFAYNSKSMTLNVGLNPMAKKNGKMKNWPKSPTNLPWYSLRGKVKKVVVGKGVTNVGNNFLYISRSKVFDGSPAMKSKLTQVKLASSVKSVGKRAFYNTPKLKKVTWKSSKKKIGKDAFAYSKVKVKAK